MPDKNEYESGNALDSNDSFTVHLSNAERERLALLLEECGEVQQIVGKILRHGYESCDPTKPNAPTNRQMLETEIGDFHMAYELMAENKDINKRNVLIACASKFDKVARFLHFQSND